MQAIVLAGGLGTRLRSVVDDVPKPMAPVHGRPFVAFVLDQLVDAGFETAILAVGYRHQVIQSYFGADYRGLALRYSVEHEPLGTGGAIRLACGQASERDVFVLNGDTYLEVDFRAMLEAHVRAGARLSMAICRVTDVARYGSVTVSDGIVTGFREKGKSDRGYINGGVYVLGVDVRDSLPHSAFSFEHDVLAPQVESLRPLAYMASGLFLDIGVPEDYARARTLLPRVDK
jgi:D-glycero-alpha-D-manno-heptose 1-phosphate guanylyltransferase